jgi:hypothetical protein
MATVLEGYTTEEQSYAVRFSWSKGLNAKDIYEEIFPFYGGKFSSSKTVHNWVKEFSEGRSKVADDARKGAEVVETIVKRLLRCGFRLTGKATGQVYCCWWRICRELNIFPKFVYDMFYILYPVRPIY